MYKNSVNPNNAIPLDDNSLSVLVDSGLSLPFVILNMDIANEPRIHKVRCRYAREEMDPDSKNENKTGSHWLILASDAPVAATRNCNCWKN